MSEAGSVPPKPALLHRFSVSAVSAGFQLHQFDDTVNVAIGVVEEVE
jgi:hypothetical protein